MKKRYGKARWIDTRLSKPYKVRRAFAHVSMAASFAAVTARLRMIAYAPAHMPGKVEAMVETYIGAIETAKTIQERIKR
jgi:hypothetical protein